ncbi:MAG: hypothetical protein AAFR73_13145, partial [Pseudomonadota bacterium]
MRVTISNDNDVVSSGTTLDFDLPANLSFAGAISVNTCGGTPDATDPTLSLSGGSVPASNAVGLGSCVIEIPVSTNLPTSAGTANITATIPEAAVTSTGLPDSETAASATIVSTLSNISGQKEFFANGGSSTNRIPFGATDRAFEILLNNPNGYDLTGATVDDVLPDGIQLLQGTPTGANSGNGVLSTTCSAGSVTSAVNSGTTTVTASGLTIPAGGSCLVRIFVEQTNTDAGTFIDQVLTNSIPAGDVTTDQGAINNSNLSTPVNIRAGIQYSKFFSPDGIGPGDISRVTINIDNRNNIQATDRDFTDVLPTNVVLAANPNFSSVGCGSPSLDSVAGDSTAAMSDVTIFAAGNGQSRCTLEFDVTSTVLGRYENTVGGASFPPIIFDTGDEALSSEASAFLTVANTGGLTVEKLVASGTGGYFNAANTDLFIRTHNTLRYRIVLTNNNASALTNIDLTDDIGATMGSNYHLFDDSVTLTGTGCTATTVAGSTATDTVTIEDLSIPANSQCLVDFNVMPLGENQDNRSNQLRSGDLVVDGNIYPYVIPSRGVDVGSRTNATKTFTPNIVGGGGVSRMEILVRTSRVDADSELFDYQVRFTDNLPSPLVVAPAPEAASTCGGLIDATPGSSLVAFSGGVLNQTNVGPDPTCSVFVNIAVPPGGGAATNTVTGVTVRRLDVPSDFPDGDDARVRTASDSLTWQPTNAALQKGFSDVSISAGETTTASISILNPNSFDLTGAGFVDVLPSGMFVANDPNPEFVSTAGPGTCEDATIAAVPGSNAITLSGGSVSANTTCAVLVDVTATRRGNITNVIGANVLTTDQAISNPDPASATVQVFPSLALVKNFTPGRVEIGEPSTLSFTISNSSGVDQNFLSPLLTDVLPTDVEVAPVPNIATQCGISVDGDPGDTTVVLNGGAAVDGQTCVVSIDVVTTSAGAFLNELPSRSINTDTGASNRFSTSATLTAFVGPTAVNDQDLNNTIGDTVTFNITGNDAIGDSALDLATVDLVPPTNAQSVVTENGFVVGFVVPGQGTWSYDDATGNITFVPQSGFTGNPDSIPYTIRDQEGDESNEATITITYGGLPLANNDQDLDNERGTTVSDLDILQNDTLATGSTPLPGEVTVDLDPSQPGDQTTLTNSDGTYTYDPLLGTIEFVPDGGLTGDPTPIPYILTETATSLSDDATITITYTDPPVANDDEDLNNLRGSVVSGVNLLDDDQLGDGSTPLSSSVTVDLDPVTPGVQTTFTNGDGTYTYNNASGEVQFVPNATLIANENDPAPIPYTLTEIATGLSDTANITITYIDPPTANDDEDLNNLVGTDVLDLDLLDNDELADGSTPDPTEVTVDLDTTTDGIQTTLTNADGTYTYDPATGTVDFEPSPALVTSGGSPTPIDYVLTETATGFTDTATITITYADGPVAENDEDLNNLTGTDVLDLDILANDELADGSTPDPT